MMQIVNADSIEKLQNLLLSTNQAKMQGDILVVDHPPESILKESWLYNFI